MGVNLTKQTVNLSKGDKVNLTKSTEEGLKEVMVGLGWQAAKKGSSTGILGALFGSNDQDIDCDAWVALLHHGKFTNSKDLVYYGSREYSSNKGKAIRHHGDNLVGGDGRGGDDEQITINLANIPDDCDSILVAVTIYEADRRHQHFGIINNAFVRVVDKRDNFEICRFDNHQLENGSTSVIVGTFQRNGNEWEFVADGKCLKAGSINKVLNDFQ